MVPCNFLLLFIFFVICAVAEAVGWNPPMPTPVKTEDLQNGDSQIELAEASSEPEQDV